ncbi:hyperosmotically inducible protein [Luteimonas cucumeris]|uniref:Osmotically-inducible protein Y n=2 Tax=Luteimonas cucumeris TaxID=985012 RepID=A0A562LDP3_9GAMM|nr:hyperosmotically inducible protein [Luteimonas cucumeris]
MNYRTSIAALMFASLVSASALAQEATPKPQTNERPMAQANEPVTDAWITTKVKADLLATDGVAGTDINVDTQNGVVTLRGTVKSQAEADRAAEIARGIEGVTRVDSQLSTSTATGTRQP